LSIGLYYKKRSTLQTKNAYNTTLVKAATGQGQHEDIQRELVSKMGTASLTVNNIETAGGK
jgi:hypothetical protein